MVTLPDGSTINMPSLVFDRRWGNRARVLDFPLAELPRKRIRVSTDAPPPEESLPPTKDSGQWDTPDLGFAGPPPVYDEVGLRQSASTQPSVPGPPWMVPRPYPPPPAVCCGCTSMGQGLDGS